MNYYTKNNISFSKEKNFLVQLWPPKISGAVTNPKFCNCFYFHACTVSNHFLGNRFIFAKKNPFLKKVSRQKLWLPMPNIKPELGTLTFELKWQGKIAAYIFFMKLHFFKGFEQRLQVVTFLMFPSWAEREPLFHFFENSFRKSNDEASNLDHFYCV